MRDVCFFTSTRADFGLLRRVMDLVRDADDLHLRIIASGSHLSPEFGNTIDEIIEAGFEIDKRIDIIVPDDSPAGVCRSMGRAMEAYGDALARMKPDVLVLLGDRYETLCAAAAAQVCRVPIAHIHGGEVTRGSIDNAFRHAITMLSELHFTACEVYRQRIIQFGIDPARVFNVGSLGVENARRVRLMDRHELPVDGPYLLVTFHPATAEAEGATEQVRELLDALDTFPTHFALFTKANADAAGRAVNAMIERYVATHADRARLIDSLGMAKYLSAMAHADAVVGNSSSGVIEAPALRVPTVNIGSRQDGRVRAMSVIDCAARRNEIIAALQRAIDPSFRESLRDMQSPLDKSGTAMAIIEVLRGWLRTDVRLREAASGYSPVASRS